jgi:hypothetical protein
MTELEVYRLGWIMAAIRGEDFMLPYLDCARLPAAPARAANDNEPHWLLILFPEGWSGSC